jgi:DNA-binding Lrp family transcriptional regulator
MTFPPNDAPPTPARALDALDRTLLGLLHDNGRMPNNQLAAAAGVSPSTCLQRIRALVDDGVIRRFTVDVEPASVGYPLEALVSVRIRPGARDQLTAFADRLRAMPEVEQFFYLAGAEDFIIHFRARTTQDLRSFVTDQLSSSPIVAGTNTSLIFEHDTGGF